MKLDAGSSLRRVRFYCLLMIAFALMISTGASDSILVSDDFNDPVGTKNTGRSLNNHLGGMVPCKWSSEDSAASIVAHPNNGTNALKTGYGYEMFPAPSTNGSRYALDVLLTIALGSWHAVGVEKNPASAGLWSHGGIFLASVPDGSE